MLLFQPLRSIGTPSAKFLFVPRYFATRPKALGAMLLHSNNYSPLLFKLFYLLRFATPFLRTKNNSVPIVRVASICRNSARRSSKKKNSVKNSAFFFCGALGRLGSAFTLKQYCSITFPRNAPRQLINIVFFIYLLCS